MRWVPRSFRVSYLLAMFILLLLLSRAGCDWVEISQNHYRKEPIHKVIHFEHTTKTNAIYRNNSVTEKQWHRGAVDKVSNVANIRRVQHPSVKTNSLKTLNEDKRFNNNFNDHTHTMEAEYNFITMKPNIQKFQKHNEEDDVSENQNKVTVIRTTTDNIRHVQHPNSKPIIKLPNAVANIDRSKHYDEKQDEEPNDVFNTNHRKQVQINKPLVEIDKLDFNENNKFYTIEKPKFNRVSLDDEINLDVSSNSNRLSNYSITKEPNATKIKLIQREENDYVKENDVYKQAISIDDKIKYKPHDTESRPLEEYYDTRNNFQNPTGSVYKNTEKIVNQPNSQKPDQNKDMEVTPSMDDEKTKFPNADDSRSKDMLNVVKGNPVKGIWKLIKVVADTIYKNTHRSFKSKVKYLEGLKTTILTSIEDQIDSVWPDDVRGAPTRHSRAAQPRGHVEFPSSESTLMTISFLTFAVFLIKLVLQVIHTYKNKTMMVTPAVVAAVGRAAAAFRTPS